MSLPFLPPDEIQPTYEQINTQNLNLEKHQMDSVEKLKLFVRRRWINQVLPEELSVWHQKMATNNGAENYQGRLKSLIKCSKPRIWNFLDTLNEIILDTNNEIGRLKERLRITRERKKKNV